MSPDIPAFLSELRRRDIHLRMEGDRLHCSAPAGALTPELEANLKARKPEVMAFLRSAYALTQQQGAIVPLQPLGKKPPLFAVGGHNGDVFCFHNLARALGREQPFYGLQPPGADGKGTPLSTVEEIAAYFVEQVCACRPNGPYLLTGFCSGGTIVFELAQQLHRAGERVDFLGLIACPHPHELRYLPTVRRHIKEQWARVCRHVPVLLGSVSEQRRYFSRAWQQHQAQTRGQQMQRQDPVLIQNARVQDATIGALRRYRPAYFPGTVHLFVPGPEWVEPGGLSARWRRWVGKLEEHYGPAGCTSESMLQEDYVALVAEGFRNCLYEDVSWDSRWDMPVPPDPYIAGTPK